MGDIELQKQINKNQAKVDADLNKMKDSFNAALGKVRKQLAKDRAHAEHRLKSSTDKVFSALFSMQKKQAKKNARMAADIRRMRLDAMNNVRKAKEKFKEHIHKLAAKVAEDDKKADLKTAIRKAIATGEKRAELVEERGEKMDKDTKFLVNNKLDAEITALRKSTDASVEALRLQSKEARKQAAKEMLYAIRSSAQVAHSDLKIAIQDGVDTMTKFEGKAAKAKAKSVLERKALAAEIEASAKSVSRMVRDAVATVAKAQTCLRAETAGKIKKHDLRVDAFAVAMKKWTAATEAHMAKTIAGTIQQIKQAQGHAKKAAKKGSTDAARQHSALEFVESQLKIAQKDVATGFIKKYNDLADDRAAADDGLAAATRKLNDALAKQAAIMDSRFSKTVKNLNAARKSAGKAVIALRKDFATKLVLVTSQVKKIETLLVNTISV